MVLRNKLHVGHLDEGVWERGLWWVCSPWELSETLPGAHQLQPHGPWVWMGTPWMASPLALRPFAKSQASLPLEQVTE